MDILKAGGVSVSASDSTALLPQKPDISAGLLRLKASSQAWKKLLAEGKVEPLVLKIDSKPETVGVPARMLSEHEQQQLRKTKEDQSNYLQRILQTPLL